MLFFVKKNGFLPFAFICLIWVAIFASYSMNSPLSGSNNIQDSFSNDQVKSLSFMGEDLSNRQGWFNKKKRKEEPNYENSADTLLHTDPIRLKLDDPDYDVRYEKGSIKPWHEIRSIYLRRQIPPSNLAAIPSCSVS